MSWDLVDKRCLVTGANTGIGKETARGLALLGAEVVFACRSEEKARAAMGEIERETGNDKLSFHPLDLSSFARVRRSAAALLDDGRAVQLLINNAGVGGRRGTTEDGWEVQMGINHLGPFQFTQELLPLLRESAPARVVNVASSAHRMVKRLDLRSYRRKTRSVSGFPDYCASKLANILTSRELGKRLVGSGVTTYALHPGAIASEIWREVPFPLRWLLLRLLKTPREGAETSLYCAGAAELVSETGRYYVDCREKKPSRLACDEDLARRIYDKSCEVVGVDSR